MNNAMQIEIPGKGYFDVQKSIDPDYPGVDVEFIFDSDEGQNLSRPRVLFEFPKDGKLRVLIWDSPNNEDYTREIEFEI